MSVIAKADHRQVILAEDLGWGSARPLKALTLEHAVLLQDDLRLAIDAVRKEDLAAKKSRLVALQKEIEQLENKIQ